MASAEGAAAASRGGLSNIRSTFKRRSSETFKLCSTSPGDGEEKPWSLVHDVPRQRRRLQLEVAGPSCHGDEAERAAFEKLAFSAAERRMFSGTDAFCTQLDREAEEDHFDLMANPPDEKLLAEVSRRRPGWDCHALEEPIDVPGSLVAHNRLKNKSDLPARARRSTAKAADNPAGEPPAAPDFGTKVEFRGKRDRPQERTEVAWIIEPRHSLPAEDDEEPEEVEAGEVAAAGANRKRERQLRPRRATVEE